MELTEQLQSELKKFLDEEGRLVQFPAKNKNKIICLLYLATKFEPGIRYTEKEINEIIECNHTFQDKWLLRRELINHEFLSRFVDGSQYWVTEVQPEFDELL
jgi:hypothetical protein